MAARVPWRSDGGRRDSKESPIFRSLRSLERVCRGTDFGRELSRTEPADTPDKSSAPSILGYTCKNVLKVAPLGHSLTPPFEGNFIGGALA